MLQRMIAMKHVLGIAILGGAVTALAGAPFLVDDFNRDNVTGWSTWADPTSTRPVLQSVAEAAEGSGAMQITFPQSDQIAQAARHRLNVPTDSEYLSFWLKIVSGQARSFIELQENKDRCPEGKDVFRFPLPLPPPGTWRQYRIPLKDFSYSFSQYGKGDHIMSKDKIFTVAFIAQKHREPFVIQIDKVEFLPGEPPASAAIPDAKVNLLSGDTSFETGSGEWVGLLASRAPQVIDGDGALGRHCLELAKDAGIHITDQPILQRGQPYTLSFYARSLHGSSPLNCMLYTDRWRAQGARLVTLSEQWQRYSFSVTASADGGSLLVFESRNKTPVRIDAIQLEAGRQMTAYRSSSPLFLAAGIDAPGGIAVRAPSDAIDFRLAVCNAGLPLAVQPLELHYTIRRYGGADLKQGREVLTLPPGQNWSAAIPVEVGNRPGYYPADVTLKDRAGNVLLKCEAPFVVAPPFGTARDPDSFFGQHPDYLPLEALHRIGVKWLRSWGPFWSDLEKQPGVFASPHKVDFHASGFEWLFLFGNLANPPAWAKNEYGLIAGGRYLTPYFQEIIRTVDRLVSAYDFQNEPDLTLASNRQGQKIPRTEALKSYIDALKAVHPILQAAGKKLLVDVSGLGADFAVEVFQQAPEAFDVYAVHPYSHQRYLGPLAGYVSGPEESGLRQKLLDARQLIEQHGQGQELWIGELGWAVDIREPLAGPYHEQLAAYLARAHLIALSVPAVKRLIWFSGMGCREANYYEYGMWIRRNGGIKPTPAAAAYATLAALFDHARFERMLLDNNFKAYLFGNRGEQIVAVWDASSDRSRPLTVNVKPEEAKIVTLTGSELSLEPGRNDHRLIITGSPLYVCLREMTPEQLLARLREAIEHQSPLICRSRVTNQRRLEIRLGNRLAKSQDITIAAVRFEPGGSSPGWTGKVARTFTVPAGKTVTTTVELERPLNDEGGKLTVDLVAAQGQRVSFPTTLPPLFPCRRVKLAQEFLTTGLPDSCRIMKFTQRRDVFPPDPVGWQGERDLGLEIFTGWDARCWYLQAVVSDSVHFQPFRGKDYWRGDSLQLAFDTGNDADSPAPGYDANDYEFGLSLENDRAVCIEGVIAGRPLNRPADGYRCTIIRQGDKTIYRLALEWSRLKFAPEPGMIFGFSCIANDNDGGGRNFWMGIPGIAPLKQPARFRKLRLTK